MLTAIFVVQCFQLLFIMAHYGLLTKAYSAMQAWMKMP